MTEQAQRFQYLINALKTNQLQLSKAIGVKFSHTNAIFNGRKQFSRAYLQKLSSQYPRINIHWLLNGVGEMFLTDLVQNNTQTVSEPGFEYSKSTNPVQISTIVDDLILRKTLGSNLERLANTWGMKKNELFGMLMPGVKKQSVTNYFHGASQPPLGVLINIERLSGIGISAWLTRTIDANELPKEPLHDGIHSEDQIQTIRKDLRALLSRIGG